MTDTSTACLGSSSKLPWELLLRIFELTAETSQISAANVAGVCQAGASIARTMLYKTLVISVSSFHLHIRYFALRRPSLYNLERLASWNGLCGVTAR